MAGAVRRLSLGVRTSDGSNAAAAWELRAGAQPIVLLELIASLVAATATTLGLGTPAAIGVTPTTPASFLDERNSSATSTARSAVAWGTGPTVPAAFYRRAALPAAVGNYVSWVWKDGLVIPKDSSLVLWNLAANSLLDVTAVIG